jgi:hypothetical protein
MVPSWGTKILIGVLVPTYPPQSVAIGSRSQLGYVVCWRNNTLDLQPITPMDAGRKATIIKLSAILN